MFNNLLKELKCVHESYLFWLRRKDYKVVNQMLGSFSIKDDVSYIRTSLIVTYPFRDKLSNWSILESIEKKCIENLKK